MLEIGIPQKGSEIRQTSATLTWQDRWDHILARLGVRRGHHRVEPGLYRLGEPTPDSPVFVTANYTLSFDALRSALAGRDGFILVLDTRGINVWCAAGKGTFGTGELVNRILQTSLALQVDHRVLIVPQLGAPSVAAHTVRKLSGFRVEYGPVRASDLAAYLDKGKATAEMRRVKFTLEDRLVLIPIELVHTILPTLLGALVAYFWGGWLAALAVLAAVFSGVILFPLLLPWLPTQEFSSKGLILGGAVALLFALQSIQQLPDGWWVQRLVRSFSYLLVMPPLTAYLSLNFTGSTPFTSKSGVKREFARYIPIMAWTLGIGLVLAIAGLLLNEV